MDCYFHRKNVFFCEKGRKKQGSSIEGLAKLLTERAEEAINERAREKCDFVMLGKIDGENLRARQARFHESCRKSYLRRDDRHKLEASDGTDEAYGKEQKAAYDAAFQFLCHYITSNIITGGSVERMTMLSEKYLQYIQEHAPKYYNPNHQTHKLKEKLVNIFDEQIKSWQSNYKCELVYSSALDTGEAVEAGF